MFFGFASALVCAVVVGSVSHWSLIWMAATAIAGIFFFPRCFYGFKEARALRDADFGFAPLCARVKRDQFAPGRRIGIKATELRALSQNGVEGSAELLLEFDGRVQP